MTTKELDFSKILFTGVKRKKPNPNQSASDGKELRIRMLPESDDFPPKKLKKQEIKVTEDNDAVQIFSSSTITHKQSEYSEPSKKMQRNLEAEAEKQKVCARLLFLKFLVVIIFR